MEYNSNENKSTTGKDNPETESVQRQETDRPADEPSNEKGFEAEAEPVETPDEPAHYTARQVYNIQRPTLLSVVCILTFIGSGFSAFSNLVLWLSQSTLKELVLTTDLYDSFFELFPEMEIQMMTMLEIPSYFYFMSALFYIGSILGAAWMWRMQRKGFHVYTISQCLLILVSMLMMPNQGIQWGSILWTGLFIALYATNMKYMNPQNK